MRPDSKKMFFLVFGKENQLLPRKKMVGVKNQLFPRKKMVLGRKTNFFLGKTKKKNKKHLLGDSAAKVQNCGFFGFP